jgi:diguanylate cyclase (GGDEF)-like protein
VVAALGTTIVAFDLPKWLHAGIGWVTAAAIVAGRRRWRPAGGRWWSLLALAMLLTGLADLLWALTVGPSGVSTDISDLAYIPSFVVIIVAIGGITGREPVDRESVLDSAVIVAGVATLVATPVVREVVARQLDLTTGIEALLYPLMALLVVGAALRALLSSRARRPALALLAAGLAVHLLADTVYAVQALDSSYHTGIADLAWLVSYALIGASALHPAMGLPARPAWARTNSISGARVALLATSSGLPLVAQHAFGLAPAVATAVLAVLVVVGVTRLAVPMRAYRVANTIDPVTGLPNRQGALAHLEDAISICHTDLYALYGEVSRIKLVNDALGHTASDVVVGQVSRALVEAVGSDVVVARMADAELLVVARAASVEDATEAAHRLVRQASRPVLVGDVAVRPRLSIGVAGCTADERPESLLRRAGAAATRARAKGSGVVVAPDAYDDALERLQLASALHAGIRSGHVGAAFQPEVRVDGGELFGFEALARWTDPDRGEVPPATFIGVAEEAGLIVELFGAVLDAALATQHRCSAHLGQPVSMSVNASPLQLGDELVEQMAAALTRWSPPPGTVWLELTESTVADLTDVVDVLGRLRDLGVCLAIDDFGTGHSSLSRLAAFPWDAIKVDRSFVSNMLHDPHAQAVVEATVALGRALGAITIAEGVESVHQRSALTALGCDLLQGYAISPPVDAAAAAALADRFTRLSTG